MKRKFSCLETTEKMRVTQDFRGRGGMDLKEPTSMCTTLFKAATLLACVPYKGCPLRD